MSDSGTTYADPAIQALHARGIRVRRWGDIAFVCAALGLLTYVALEDAQHLTNDVFRDIHVGEATLALSRAGAEFGSAPNRVFGLHVHADMMAVWVLLFVGALVGTVRSLIVHGRSRLRFWSLVIVGLIVAQAIGFRNVPYASLDPDAYAPPEQRPVNAASGAFESVNSDMGWAANTLGPTRANGPRERPPPPRPPPSFAP